MAFLFDSFAGWKEFCELHKISLSDSVLDYEFTQKARSKDETIYPTHFTSWGEWMQWTHPNAHPITPKLSFWQRHKKKRLATKGQDSGQQDTSARKAK